MKSIEQYIKEKLHLPDAPAEVDADDLWAGIETNLPAAKKAPLAPWPWKRLFFALLFLVVGGLAGWLILNTPEAYSTVGSPGAKIAASAPAPTQSSTATDASQRETVSRNRAQNEALSTDTEADALSGQNNSSAKGSPQAEASSQTSPAPAAAPQDRSSRTPPESASKDQSINALAKASSQKITSATSDTYTPLANNKKTATAPDQEPNIAHNAGKSNNDATENTISTIAQGLKLAATPTLTAHVFQLLSVPPPALPTPKATYRPTFRNTLKNRFSLGLNAGANLLSTRYATPEAGPEALNPAVKSAAGSSFGLDFRYRISKQIAFSAGLEYHRTLNTFEHTTQRDSAIQHPSPFNSGPIDAIFSRRVADNLRTNFFTAPVLIHWTQTKGDFDFGIGAGIGLNFRQLANGTTLSPAGDFVPFDAATGASPTPKFFTSYRLAPSVSYRLKPKSQLSLEAKADFHYLPFGADELSGLKRNSFVSGLNIGLRYGF